MHRTVSVNLRTRRRLSSELSAVTMACAYLVIKSVTSTVIVPKVKMRTKTAVRCIFLFSNSPILWSTSSCHKSSVHKSSFSFIPCLFFFLLIPVSKYKRLDEVVMTKWQYLYVRWWRGHLMLFNLNASDNRVTIMMHSDVWYAATYFGFLPGNVWGSLISSRTETLSKC